MHAMIENPQTHDMLARDMLLVGADALAGMALVDRDGHKLGVIKDFYIDKVTGQVEFVVGATGGFLGVGEKFHPLPWRSLTYSASSEAYVTAFSKKEIEDAPAYDKEQLASTHYGWGEQVRRYFGALGHPI
jgi:sporulation protein YlmC with PRC-barrel domain